MKLNVFRKLMTPLGLAVAIVVVGAAAVAVSERLGARQLHEFTHAQGVDASRRVLEAFEHARLEAKLMAAEPDLRLMARWVQDDASDTAITTPPDATGVASVMATLRPPRPGNLLRPGLTLQLPVAPMPGAVPVAALYPAKAPTHLLLLSAGRDGLVSVSAVNLEGVLRDINPDVTDYVDFELSDAASSRALAHTEGWGWPAYSVEAVDALHEPMELTLRTRPSKMYPESIASSHPARALFGVLVLAGAVYLLTAKLMTALALLRQQRVAWKAAQESYAANLEINLTNFTDAAGAMLWLARPDGSVQLFGPWPELEGRENSGFTFEELTEGARDRESLARSLLKAVNERTSWAYTHQKDLDGERHVFQHGAAPLFTPMGEYVGLFGIRTNVSEVVRAQQAVSKTEEIRAGQESYLSNLSDELSAPAHQTLAAFRHLQAALDKGDSQEATRWLGVGVVAAERVDRTVKGALEGIRQRGGGPPAVLSTAPIDPCVHDVIRTTGPAAERLGRHIIAAGRTSQNACFSAPNLARVLTELIGNAMKFTAPGTTVAVELGEADDRCFVSVTDEGPGMTDEELQRIARPFYRTAAGARVAGRGVGIAMAKELVEAMGAELSFARATRAGKGLVATVYMPIASDAQGWPQDAAHRAG